MRRRALLVIAALVVLPACASSSGGDADAVTHTCPDEDPTTSGDSCCCWEGIASTYECVDGLWQCQSGQEFTGEMCTDPTGPCWTQVGPEPDAGPSSDTVETPPPAWAEYAAEIPVVKRERAAAEVCADGFVESGFESGQHDGYEAGGQMRGFYLGLPDPALYPGPRPLMLALNGTGGTGLKAYNNYGGAGWVDAGVIFLAPDSNANGVVWPSWYSMIPPGEPDENNPDMLYIDSLLDCASAHLEVDEHRLYVSGHSAGGIMTNYVLQHRPDTFAGGVPASSILDLTAPTPALSMPPMAIIVMWGGDNDIWGGDSEAESVAVPEFDFREQAAIASAFYEGVDGAHQVHCKGADLGHSWVHGADDFVRDFLLAHPKGLAQNPGWVIDDAPAVIEGACSEDVYEYEKAVTVTCDESETEGCQPVCQLLGDCLVENATVAPVLGPPLETIGFDGDDCTGCVTTCEELTGDTADSAMACMMEWAETAECGDGIAGALPAISAVNACCIERPESALCALMCEAIVSVSVAIAFVEEGCAAWIPETTCTSGDDCGDDEFCDFPDDDCGWLGGEGVCTERPQECVAGGAGACGCTAGSIGTNGCEVQSAGVDYSGLGGCAFGSSTEVHCGTIPCDAMMEYCHIAMNDITGDDEPAYTATCQPNACIDPGPPTCACVPEAEQTYCHDDTGYPMVVYPGG